MKNPNEFSKSSVFGLLVEARRNMSLFQHHDGVTGTETAQVVIDYGEKSAFSHQQVPSKVGSIWSTNDAYRHTQAS